MNRVEKESNHKYLYINAIEQITQISKIYQNGTNDEENNLSLIQIVIP